MKKAMKTLRQFAANHRMALLALIVVLIVALSGCGARVIDPQTPDTDAQPVVLDADPTEPEPEPEPAELDKWCTSTTNAVYRNSDGYMFVVRAGEMYNSKLWTFIAEAETPVYVNDKPMTYAQFLDLPFADDGTTDKDGKLVPSIEEEYTRYQLAAKYPAYYDPTITNLVGKKGRLDELHTLITDLGNQKATLEQSIADLSAKRDALTPASTYSEIREISVALSTASRQYSEVVISLAKALEERDYCEASFEKSKSDLGTTDTLWILVNRKTCEVQNWSWPSHIECEPSEVNFADKTVTGTIEGPDRRVYGIFTLSFNEVIF